MIKTAHLASLNEQIHPPKKKSRRLRKGLLIVVILFVALPLMCFITWNVLALSMPLKVEHGYSELGEYYFLSTPEKSGVVIQWQISRFAKRGAVLFWICKGASNGEEGYCYIQWIMSWPPLKLTFE